MTDVLTAEQRRLNMSRIRGRDTVPEMTVRRLVYGMGYRYRLYAKDLPGKPDIVFRPRRKVIFVHGCFWHMHRCKQGRVKPKTRAEFWEAKRRGNVERDRRNRRRLRAMGWCVLEVWQCQLRDMDRVADRIIEFLES